MAEDKNIRFRAYIDTGEFDRALSDVQRKLQRMQQDAKRAETVTRTLGQDPQLGPYAQKYFGGAAGQGLNAMRQEEQELRKKFASEQQNLEDKIRKVRALEAMENKLNERQKERLDILKKQTEELEKQQKTILTDISSIQQARAQAGDTTIPGVGGPGQPPGRPGVGAQVMAAGRQMLGNLGIAAIVSGIGNALVTGIGDIISRDRVITQARGEALRGGVNQDIRAQMAGRGSQAFFFAEERAQAMRMAQEEAQGERLRTGVGTGVSIGAGIAGGAAIGSIFGPVGTVVGGAIGGAGAFATRMFASDRARQQIFDPTRFGAQINQEAIARYNMNLDAIKEQNIEKTIAGEYFGSNARRMAELEYSLGVNTRDLVGRGTQKVDLTQFMNRPAGDTRSFSALAEEERARVERENADKNTRLGLLRTQMNVGEQYGGPAFTQQEIEGRMMGILQAGGTTEAARGLAGVSAGLRRQFGLGNANQLIGRLTGQAGMGVAQTEEATKKLLAEAQAAGIRLSGMPRELERFTDMTSKLITAGGGMAMGAGEIAAAGLIGFDQSAFAAAEGAAQRFMQRGKAAGGFEGQMGYGFLQSQEAQKIIGRRMSSDEMNLLNQFSYGEARQEDLQAIAERFGISTQEANELLRQKDLYKQTRTGRGQEAITQLGKFMQEQGLTSVEEAEKSKEKITVEGEETTVGKQARALMMRVRETRAAEMGTQFTGLTGDQQRAEMNMLARLATGAPGQELDLEAVRRQQQAAPSAATQELGSQAVGDKARLEAVAKNLDDLARAASRHTEQAEIFVQQMTRFNQALQQANDSGALEGLATDLEKLRDSIQSNRPGGLNVQSGSSDN